MANYNLTKIISKRYATTNENVSTEEKRVVEYFLNQDFDKLLGKHVLSQDDCDLVTSTQDGITDINIECTCFDSMHVKIGNMNSSNIICGYSNDRVVFSIVNKDGNITNEVEYVDTNDINVQESLGLVLEENANSEKNHIDAIEFTLARKENGEDIYEGSLSPVLARAGAVEYFEFKAEKGSSDKAPSFIEKLIDGLNSNSIISVPTNNDTHLLIDYIDTIFASLKDRLEKTRNKKNVKVKSKKRVLDKKND